MVTYKLSSQFTDYVLSRSTNPNKILEQVGEALSELGLDSGGIAAFHETSETDPVSPEPSISDEDMMEMVSGNPDEKAKFINRMYLALKGLETTGKLDQITRRTIERFFQSYWKPLETSEVKGLPAGVVRRRPTPDSGIFEKPDAPEINQRENVPSWERQEDRMAWLLDRNKENSGRKTAGLFVQAGILERVPDIKERANRLIDRKYNWIKTIA